MLRTKRYDMPMILFLIVLLSIPTNFGMFDRQFVMAATSTSTSTNSPTLQMQRIDPLSVGAMQKTYIYSDLSNEDERSVPVHVIETRLDAPYTDIQLVFGKASQIAEKQLVQTMVKGIPAVAAVNGDYFNPKADAVALGAQVQQGKVISSPSQLTGMYTFGITKDRKAFIGQYGFEGTLFAANGATYPISGINKTGYWTEPVKAHSHADTIQMYTNAWQTTQRGNDGVTYPCEAFVDKEIVLKVSCAPIPQIPGPEGVVFRSAGIAAKWLKENIHEGDRIQWQTTLVPLQSPDTPKQEEIQTLIGGHTLLLRAGKATSFSRDVASIQGNRARTAIGMSADRNTVYMIVISGNDAMKGVRMQTLQSILLQLGVTDAINLDGGGSSQLVVRSLGEPEAELKNTPEFDRPRPVVNGIAVTSTPPEGNQLIFRDAPPFQWLNEPLQLDQAAYDEYFSPIPTRQGGAWTEQGHVDGVPLGTIESNAWTATVPGATVLAWKPFNGSELVKNISINVAGFEELKQLNLDMGDWTEQPFVRSGQMIRPKLSGSLMNGAERELPLSYVDWNCEGADTQVTLDGLAIQIGKIRDRSLTCIFSYQSIRIPWEQPTEHIVFPYQWNLSSERKAMQVKWNNSKKSNPLTSKMIRKDVLDRKNQLALQFTAARLTKSNVKPKQYVPGSFVVQFPAIRKAIIPDGFNPHSWAFDVVGDSHDQKVTFANQLYPTKGTWQTIQVPTMVNKRVIKPLSITLADFTKPLKEQIPSAAKSTLTLSNIRLNGYFPLVVAEPFTQSLKVGSSEAVRLINDRLYVDIRALARDPYFRMDWDGGQRRMGWIGPNRSIDWWTDRSILVINGIKEEFATNEADIKWLGSGSNLRPFVAVVTLRDAFGYQFDWQKKVKKLVLIRTDI